MDVKDIVKIVSKNMAIAIAGVFVYGIAMAGELLDGTQFRWIYRVVAVIIAILLWGSLIKTNSKKKKWYYGLVFALGVIGFVVIAITEINERKVTQIQEPISTEITTNEEQLPTATIAQEQLPTATIAQEELAKQTIANYYIYLENGEYGNAWELLNTRIEDGQEWWVGLSRTNWQETVENFSYTVPELDTMLVDNKIYGIDTMIIHLDLEWITLWNNVVKTDRATYCLIYLEGLWYIDHINFEITTCAK